MYPVMNPDVQKAGGQRFMYVKQELLESMRQKQPKVLVNPNFVNAMQVKPHFNKQFLSNQTIHFNPNMLKNNCSNQHNTSVIESKSKELVKHNLLVSTPTVRVHKLKEIACNRTRRVSIHTQYKIIRASSPTHREQTNNSKSKSRFAIDRRSLLSKSKTIAFNNDSRVKTTSPYSKCNVRLNKNEYVNINGVMYRRRSYQLKRDPLKCKSKSRIGSSLKSQILTIRGQKYKMDSAHRTLTAVVDKPDNFKPILQTIYVGGMSFKRKEPNVYVKANSCRQHLLLSQAKQKSINTLRNKLKKSNMPCPLYHRFGKCSGKELGKCIRLHNPEQISLCPKYLQGACTNDKCLLSHKISAEKVATCKFFLEGLCSKDDCPYLHVKINSKAEICKDFLDGFCQKAAECEKRHQYLCADFERAGKCSKKNCQYPHGNVVRKYKFSKLIAEKLQGKTNRRNVKDSKTFPNSVELTSSKNTDRTLEMNENLPDKLLNVRYYNESKSNNKEVLELAERPDIGSVNNSIHCTSLVTKRPQLGSLPSFIPFSEKEQSETVIS